MVLVDVVVHHLIGAELDIEQAQASDLFEVISDAWRVKAHWGSLLKK